MKVPEENKILDRKAEETLKILDLQVDLPDGLINKVVNKTQKIEIKPTVKIDFSKYLQIAAVFIAAIFIGILMGKNADFNSISKNQNKKNKALIELREKHHLNEKNSFGHF